MPSNESVSRDEQSQIPAYHLLEINEIFERTRSYSNLRVQIATFFGTIDLTTLGLAFSLQKAGLFFVAGATLIFWMLADTYAKRELLPFYYRGLQLEKLYAPERNQALLHTYLAVAKSRRDLVPWLDEVAQLATQEDRVHRLRNIRPTFGGLWPALTIATATELVLGLIFWLLVGWPWG